MSTAAKSVPKDAMLLDMEMELKGLMEELALVQKGSSVEESYIADQEREIASLKAKIAGYKKSKGIVTLEDIKAAQKSAEPAKDTKDAKDTKESKGASPYDEKISKLESDIKALERKLFEGTKAKWKPEMLGKLSQAICSKKMEQMALEEQRDAVSSKGKNQEEINRLKEQLDYLYSEKASIDQQISVTEGRLHELEGGKAKAKSQENILDDFDDDNQRVQESMMDRRKKYKEMYGSDPSG